MRYYFTFGSDERFPFQNTFLVVDDIGRTQAIATFRMRYPNRPGSDCYNASECYSETEWAAIHGEALYGKVPASLIKGISVEEGTLRKVLLTSGEEILALLITDIPISEISRHFRRLLGTEHTKMEYKDIKKIIDGLESIGQIQVLTGTKSDSIQLFNLVGWDEKYDIR